MRPEPVTDSPFTSAVRPEAILRAENTSIYYGSFLAVQDVNLDIFKNRITAFIGPSGCGK
ncbi:MAG TPA: phosphate ABC transporter ATP-binding protein, partial [Cyanobacteria bacterium UBA9273]|nr:phosphate ABC transporter ATP-binding protein [Cyanobacteria bacterium UBA9273]